MISHRKKNGFTITETVIVMTLTVIVLGIIWMMLSISNKIISDVTIKSDLQREGQAIQEELSNIGMEASGIESIDEGDIDDTGEVKKITINSYYKHTSPHGFQILKESSEQSYKSGKIRYNLKIGNSLFSNNVESIKIINKDNLSENNYIDLTIKLSKDRNYNNIPITYDINVRTVFRNKNALGT